MSDDVEKKKYGVVNADCLEAMKKMPDNCVDAVVTDPPYGLSFMGKNWDHGVPGVEFWKEALRIAKPGAHLLSFGGTRTFHRIACAIEDAGWEIRDTIMWVYGSGFPKSMDISKAIDKKLGAERTEVVGTRHRNVKPFDDGNGWNSNNTTGDYQYMAPASEEAKKWSGWGTCLKPAYEPVIMARKPLEGTVADTVLKYGTGGINIDECRVPYKSDADKDSAKPQGVATAKVGALAGGLENDNARTTFTPKQTNGRFPANIIHDGSDEVVSLFPESNGGAFPKSSNTPAGKHYEGGWGKVDNGERKEMDSGSAARFFYTIKPECEPVIMARKPIEGTVADNVLKYGTGGINIDECRVPSDKPVVIHSPAKDTLYDSGHKDMGTWTDNRGRFPANVIHDGSEEVLELFPDNVKGGTWNNTKGARHFENNGKPTEYTNKGSDNSVGSAARFFYCSKASKSEKGKDNPHPTVKPLELMKYLIKMVAPKGALVLDPFMGSGSTGVAAVQIGRRFIGIEKEEEYFNYAKKRIEDALPKS